MRLLFFIILVLAFNVMRSQEREKDFELTPLKKHYISKSLYNTISLIDTRDDTTDIGIVQTGALNKATRVVPKTPLARQFSNLLDSIITPEAAQGHLLLQIRKFSFAELTDFAEYGYCHFRAVLYTKNDSAFRRLTAVDTVISLETQGDITKSLFKQSTAMIVNFIGSKLSLIPADTTIYSLNNIIKIDSVEKSMFPLYNTANFTDGIYYSFTAFRSQVPDKAVSAVINNNELTKIRAIEKNGDKKKIYEDDTYAIVFKGVPYIRTDFGFSVLKKASDDFYFVGEVKVTPSSGAVVGSFLAHGVIGAAITTARASAIYEVKLDHINGKFIRIREMPPE